jgi:hypothetical protein
MGVFLAEDGLGSQRFFHGDPVSDNANGRALLAVRRISRRLGTISGPWPGRKLTAI